MGELLTYLLTADYLIREELALKIALMAERFAPNKTWRARAQGGAAHAERRRVAARGRMYVCALWWGPGRRRGGRIQLSLWPFRGVLAAGTWA